MKLSIIVPAYNEIGTIAELVGRLEQLPLDTEIILIDNCSTDGTREWIRDYPGAARRILHEVNTGKGGSVRDGLAVANGDAAIIQDADLEYDPREIPALLAPLERGECDVVFGSRELGGKQPMNFAYALGRDLLNGMTNRLFFGSLTDVATCYKLMSREVYRGLALHSNGFNLDFEIAARILRQGYRIREVPISYRARTWEQGKKIRLRDGWSCLWTLLKVKFE